ncbi:MAG: hypothetical protein JWO47_19 [Candidatus Saccharibacteria bacterium]|nr:hypothetical protein [Candidatus Saccharibacteria bacterium]
MSVEINWLAVVLAAVSSMVVGSIWYAPKVFGNGWMKMTKSKMGKGASAGKMAWMYGSVFVASLVTAYILAHVAFLSNRFFGHSYLIDALSTAAWLWLGFTATRLYVHDTFEERRKLLTVVNAGHELVTLLVMALIIGFMGV